MWTKKEIDLTAGHSSTHITSYAWCKLLPHSPICLNVTANPDWSSSAPGSWSPEKQEV